jgi:hypothetical protein
MSVIGDNMIRQGVKIGFMLREEHRSRVLERIFGLRWKEVAGGWRRLHKEELHNLYASPNIISIMKSTRMRWAGLVVCMGEMRNAHRILVGKPEGKRPPGRPVHKWEGNIRMDLG